jgi:small subunit ribosomal protein S2
MILVKFSLKRLLNSNVHLSMSSRRWNNYAKTLVSFKYRNFYFIDLMKTMYNLKLSTFFITYLIKNRGNILFIEKRLEFFVLLRYLKIQTNQDYIGKYWISGSFTNFSEFKLNRENKRDSVLLEKSGLYNLTRLPEAVISFSLYANLNGLNEARVLGIPTISLVGSDLNPSGLNFILPANDISKNSIYLFVQIFKFAILKGNKMEKIMFYGLLKKFCYLFFIKRLLLVKK